MNLTNNVVLITGGSSGLGFELSKSLVARNNKVLICGRSAEKLEKAQKALPEIEYFQCDISQIEDCVRLENWISENHPNCNILINNAAIVHTSNFYSSEGILAEARAEIETNLMAPIVLSKMFIPIIEKNIHPHIINITTGLIYAPKITYPFYNATKAGLHSFTMVLREHLKNTGIRVKEVMFPAVDTPWHKGNAPKIAISAPKAIELMLNGLGKNKQEVRVAGAGTIYKLSRLAPSFAFKLINKIAKN